MSPREGIYYAGLMGGVAATTVGLRSLGVHHIVSVIIGGVVGLSLGWALERTYSNWKAGQQRQIDQASGKNPANNQIDCSNPYCNWSGEKPFSEHCPRCGTPLK